MKEKDIVEPHGPTFFHGFNRFYGLLSIKREGVIWQNMSQGLACPDLLMQNNGGY